MHLIVLLSFLIFSVHFSRISVFDRLQFLEKKLHTKCIVWLPSHSNSLPELKALVCGENFEQLQISQHYLSTGLIHLFVVSGAHLMVLKIIADFILSCLISGFVSEKNRSILVLIFLFFYAAACEFNPPIVRAFCLIAIISLNNFSKAFWPTHFSILIAGFLSLFFHSNWITSLSLQLSWLISIAGTLGLLWLNERHALVQQSFQTLWIYPTLLLFQTPNPFFILTNFIFSKFLEIFLFPFALLVSIFPFFVFVFDAIINFLKVVLGKTEILIIPSELSEKSFFISLNWILIFSLHVCCHLSWVKRKRANEQNLSA